MTISQIKTKIVEWITTGTPLNIKSYNLRALLTNMAIRMDLLEPGRLRITKAQGNTALELEIGDIVYGIIEGQLVREAIYLGGDQSLLENYLILDGPPGGAPSEHHEYADIDAMLADQGSQAIGDTCYVTDATDDPDVVSGDAVYLYLGTTVGNLTDYRRLTDGEVQQILFPEEPQRKRKVINIVDNTTAPPTEVEGDRYILDNTGSSHVGWDGAFPWDIVEFVGGEWIATKPEEGWTLYVDALDVDYRFIDDGSPAWEEVAGGTNGVTTTIITDTDTVFNGTQKGQENIYRFNKLTGQTLLLDPDDYITDELVVFERGELGGSLEIIAPSGVTHCGYRNIENRYFLNDRNSLGFAKKLATGKMLITGNITRGYTGAVTVSSYSTVREGDTGVELTITGTGFSENTLISFSTGITLNSVVSVSSTVLVLNVDITGVEDDTVTPTFDNGDVFEDTDGITIAAASSTELYNNYAFDIGYALFKSRDTQTYPVTVQRSSDSATTQVAPNGSGKIALDSITSATGNPTLTTWAGSDDVFILDWDNPGALTGFTASQADTTKQAKLLNAGALITVGGIAMAEYDGANDYYRTSDTDAWANGDWTIFCNINSNSAAQGMAGGYLDSSAANRMPVIRWSSANTIQALIPNDAGTQDILASGTLTPGTTYKVVVVSNSTGTALYINGSSVDTGAAPSSTPTDVQPIELGGDSEVGSNYLGGYGSYFFLYKSDQASNISEIQTIIDSSL